MSKINFSPGPSQLYFTVEGHVRQAFREGIPSMSHRSKKFESIYEEVSSGLRQLLTVPENYHLVFTGSATEVWERSIQNFVVSDSLHFVNGAFSKKYFDIASQLGKHPLKIESLPGNGFAGSGNFPASTELVALTHNETSTGVSLPLSFINSFREKYPDALIMVDAVSSLPYPAFDYNKVDAVFFSVQKAFGLPAGLGVWMLNDRCVARAEQLQRDGVIIGSYHSVPTLVASARKHQTPETPNVLAIYLLGKIVQDFLARGIQTLRRETEYKAAILYDALENNDVLKPFVSDKAYRSQTVAVAACGVHTSALARTLEEKGMLAGEGYGEWKNEHLRIANFPTHSKEQFELLVDTIAAFKG